MTNDASLAEQIRIISKHGQSKKYIHNFVGINSRLDSIQAGVLRIKLDELENFNERRINVANYYDKHFLYHCDSLSLSKIWLALALGQL